LTDNRKGITESVFLNGNELTGWEMYPLPLGDISGLHFAPGDRAVTPAFHRGTFRLEKTGDTFLDMRGWGKGSMWVNGHNLGRFWYIGPQQTLYCPGVWLKTGENEIVVLEIEDHGKRSVQGLKDPILDQLLPDELAPPRPKRRTGVLRPDSSDFLASGSFVPGDSEQVVPFKSIQARYVILQSLSSLRNDPFASISELNLLDEHGKKLPREGWKVYYVDSEELTAEDGRAENSFDDDLESIWHSEWSANKPPHPHMLAIDIGAAQTISALIYRSRQGNAPGKIREYKVYARLLPPEIR
jgi:beta-galactosidase